jgi:hypothetical protein
MIDLGWTVDPVDQCNDPSLLEAYLTPEQIRFVRLRRNVYQKECETLAVCDVLSKDISQFMSLRFVVGKFDHQRAPARYNRRQLRNTYHCWCLFDDDTILDCSADQFGMQGIQIRTPNDSNYLRWRVRKIVPELKRIRDLFPLD